MMDWYMSCMEEVRDSIDSAKSELRGPSTYLNELVLEGYKYTIGRCLLEVLRAHRILKYSENPERDIDFEEIEEARKRYMEVKKDIESIIGREIKFPKADRIFENPIVMITTVEPDVLETFSEKILRP
ncbi:MAG: hypothetical protein J7K87_04470 [Candidatus Aenigmarchaeota archaeon]|nr:hypothetical protein [Candidatus Aenigmarchaeota archaeon]